MPRAADGWRLAVCWPPCLLATSQLAVALVNWFATLLVTPPALPRMDFSRASRRSRARWCRADVAHQRSRTSTSWSRRSKSASSPIGMTNLRFGLLTDFRGCARGDAAGRRSAAAACAQKAIEELNEQVRAATGDVFFLFHRPRRWNARERRLDGIRAQARQARRPELRCCAAARSRRPSDSRCVVGDIEALANVYVITLDTDTQLPRDAARAVVGTMAHPLNRPRFDAATARSCEATASCSRAWPEPAGHEPLALRAAVRRRCRASIRTRARCPTSTRTCSARARSSARASMTSTHSNRR